MPELPTAAEAGVPGYEVTSWHGFVVPAGTPQPVIDKLHKAMADVLAKPTVKQRLERVGAVVNLSTPAEFKQAIESDIKNFKDVAKSAGLQAQ